MKLSDLTPGKLYRMTADDVDATIQVVSPGAMPLCILHGHAQEHINTEGAGYLLAQLIGWEPWGDSAMTPHGLQMLITDEQPSEGFLIGAWLSDNGDGNFVRLACAPKIVELDPKPADDKSAEAS